MLGDRLEYALGVAGVTSERIERWLGKPCGCEERKQKLNDLDRWARRIVQGKVRRAKEYLFQILD